MEGLGLYIENEDWQNNLAKDDTIQLHLLNKSFNYTIQIKEKLCLGFIFLLGQKPSDKIVTKFNILIQLFKNVVIISPLNKYTFQFILNKINLYVFHLLKSLLVDHCKLRHLSSPIMADYAFFSTCKQ